MKYELTPDLLTGHDLIDAEHKKLLMEVNHLMDACAQGKGRDHIQQTMLFLNDYVSKHFGDEEKLQVASKYPNYTAHKQFHTNYKNQLAQITQEIQREGVTVKALGDLNRAVAVLVSHIRTEDKKLAIHVKEQRSA